MPGVLNLDADVTVHAAGASDRVHDVNHTEKHDGRLRDVLGDRDRLSAQPVSVKSTIAI
jgi:hypothetical protein